METEHSLEKLQELEKIIHKAITNNHKQLEKWADHTANLVNNSIDVTSDRWTALFKIHEHLVEQAEKLNNLWEEVSKEIDSS